MPGILTINTPPTSATLTTLPNAKGDLAVTSTTDDAYITGLIARASNAIANHCGRVFGYQLVTEIFRYGAGSYIGPSAQSVAPYGTPLAAQFKPVIFSLAPVRALTINENADPALTGSTDYDLDAPAGLAWRVRSGLRSWWGVPTVTASYGSGYVLPNDSAITGVSALPGAVEEACISLVRTAYMRRGRDPSVILDLVEGVGRTGYAKIETVSGMSIDDALAEMLQPFCQAVW